MLYTTTYLNQPRISVYGLDPDTPESDYEIHLIRATDPAYIPPDSELWPLYFTKIFEIVQRHPAVRGEISKAMRLVCEKVKGLRALPPVPVGTPRQPNEPNPLPIRPSLGSRTYPDSPKPTQSPTQRRH